MEIEQLNQTPLEPTASSAVALRQNTGELVVFGEQDAIAALTELVTTLTPEQVEDLDEERTKSILKFAEEGFVASAVDVADCVDIYTRYKADPTKVRKMLTERDYDIATIASVYEARAQMPEGSLSTLSDMVDLCGADILNDDNISSIETLVNGIAGEMMAKREKYGDTTSITRIAIIRGIAFNKVAAIMKDQVEQLGAVDLHDIFDKEAALSFEEQDEIEYAALLEVTR